jgi:hypothetical protein
VLVSTDSGNHWHTIQDQTLNIQSLAILKGDLFAGVYNCGIWHNEFPKKPLLFSCQDVPNDQGANVLLKWNSSLLDTNVNLLPYYSIWRAIPISINKARVKTSIVAQPPSQKIMRIVSSSSSPSPVIYWEWIANQPAHCAPGYSFTANTLYDSTALTNGKHFFMISAQTSDPGIFYDSNIDSVCSIDNISPSAPQHLSGNQTSTSITLTWMRNYENDLNGYALYRSTTPIKDTDTLSRYASTSDTMYSDHDITSNSEYYYALRAEDIHGNMSPFSNQLNFTVTDVTNSTAPSFAYSLEQNYPNPFNPTTAISFCVQKQEYTEVKIFDIMGREVVILISEILSPGRYTYRWNASQYATGIYLYQITSGAFRQTKKLLFLK